RLLVLDSISVAVKLKSPEALHCLRRQVPVRLAFGLRMPLPIFPHPTSQGCRYFLIHGEPAGIRLLRFSLIGGKRSLPSLRCPYFLPIFLPRATVWVLSPELILCPNSFQYCGQRSIPCQIVRKFQTKLLLYHKVLHPVRIGLPN